MYATCGGGLARDGGVSGDINVDCAGLIAGKPAPIVLVPVTTNFVFGINPCGSGLARDGGMSGDIDVDCAGLIASKPAPTVLVPVTTNFVFGINPCGSGLARDGGMSGDIDVDCAGLIAGKPAPTGVTVPCDDWHWSGGAFLGWPPVRFYLDAEPVA